MKKKILSIVAIVLLAMPTVVRADEGMWIPMLLGRNEAAMQRAGMHISAADIYDINNSTMATILSIFFFIDVLFKVQRYEKI